MANKARLSILAAVLENLAEDNPFDLTEFGGFKPSPTAKVSRHKVYTTADRHEPCGTVACAIGYGALDPRLQDAGLTLRATCHDGSSFVVANTSAFNALALRSDIAVLQLHAAGHESMSAARSFFDISTSEMDSVFMSRGYAKPPTPHQVAAKIRSTFNIAA